MSAERLPMVVPAQDLPARVRIHEVGARDGLQNEKTSVPTAVKAPPTVARPIRTVALI